MDSSGNNGGGGENILVIHQNALQLNLDQPAPEAAPGVQSNIGIYANSTLKKPSSPGPKSPMRAIRKKLSKLSSVRNVWGGQNKNAVPLLDMDDSQLSATLENSQHLSQPEKMEPVELLHPPNLDESPALRPASRGRASRRASFGL